MNWRNYEPKHIPRYTWATLVFGWEKVFGDDLDYEIEKKRRKKVNTPAWRQKERKEREHQKFLEREQRRINREKELDRRLEKRRMMKIHRDWERQQRIRIRLKEKSEEKARKKEEREKKREARKTEVKKTTKKSGPKRIPLKIWNINVVDRHVHGCWHCQQFQRLCNTGKLLLEIHMVEHENS